MFCNYLIGIDTSDRDALVHDLHSCMPTTRAKVTKIDRGMQYSVRNAGFPLAFIFPTEAKLVSQTRGTYI